MRTIDMSYYNVYYYCNIIDNLLYLFTTDIDWAPTSGQYKESFYEGDVTNFPKYSALHDFCDYAIRTLISEEDEKMLEEVSDRYDDDNDVSLNADERLKYAFSGIDSLWILSLAQRGGLLGGYFKTICFGT